MSNLSRTAPGHRRQSAARAGVDEAGRGPLAGPVVAAAVILRRSDPIAGLDDSKLLAPGERERLAPEIRARSVAWAIGWADVEEIATLNILGATLLAMRRALLGLSIPPTHIQVDGDRCPSLAGLAGQPRGEAVVRGDQTVPEISAASILAKTYRDHWMMEFDRVYPSYGFAAHKGYATPQHLAALGSLGPCPLHRRGFSPVECAAEAALSGATVVVVDRRLVRAAPRSHSA